jgi:signal transduction histidine kinase/DNA-binding response OmpR family regulator|uniref:Histidine kinase n=1 Tax=viral metagenome TaxID=1070528 RepID=A0A6C0J468_9ZZZZ
MLNTKFLEYLNNSINKGQDVEDLINIIKIESKSELCTIFLSINNTYQKVLSTLDGDIDLEISTKIYDINYDPSIVTTPTIYKFSLLIPIQTTEHLGLIHLARNSEEFTEYQILPYLSVGISIVQNFLEKEKILFEKNRLNYGKELFLANMSHEIRTPANGVIGYSQLLMQTQLNTTQKSYLQSQNQCSLQLMQIINDLLDFSKLASGKMEVRNDCFCIQEIIETLKNTTGQKIQEKNQSVDFIISEDLNQFMISDKQKVVQILINLISNANKFTDVNGIIKVSFYLNDNKLVISVKDNGIGIAEDKQSKLFSIYEQIENNGTKTGSGLGLAICEKLSTLLNGYIQVKSKEGEGSEFIVMIEYKPFNDYELKLKQDLDLLKDKSVLIVDDNLDNRILLTELLFEWKMKPIACASALEALRLIMGDRHDFSFGLIDIVMPGISGIDLALQIREEKPFFPMIALSSLDTFVNTKEFDEKLDKPINKIKLLETIYRTLIKERKPKSYIGQSDFKSLSSSSDFTQFKKDSKILITEDILYNRTLLENILQSLNYTNITTTENGLEAFNIIEKAYNENEPFEILLLDLRMPIMDGFAVIDKININGWKLPEIIVVTASTMDYDIINCKKMGVKYFITKPIDINQLNEVMLHVSTKKEVF